MEVVVTVAQDVVLPLEGFSATRRGRVVTAAAPLDLSKVISPGLLIADRQAGAFRLDLVWMGAILD